MVKKSLAVLRRSIGLSIEIGRRGDCGRRNRGGMAVAGALSRHELKDPMIGKSTIAARIAANPNAPATVES